MCSSHDIEHNLSRLEKYLLNVAEKGSKVALLPENFAYISKNHQETLKNAKKVHLVLDFLSRQAQKHHLWIIAGSLLVACEHDDKLHNRCFTFAPDGKQHSYYDKMHLFDVDLDNESWQESKHIQAGTKPISITIDAHWKAGISICYDLRFPELYRHYSEQGCNILTVSAAFTVPTGKAHWQTLLQARAIENQCYVLAAAQSGTHSDGRETYGHSMIIDPWGKIITELEQGEGIISAQLSHKYLQHIRHTLPALQHRTERL